MVFSVPYFLFRFLPVVLILYFVAGRRLRNLLLLAASLYFYAWGEKEIVLLMLTSIGVNYGLGLAVDGVALERSRRALVGLAVAFNIGLLVVFKYASWLTQSANAIFARLGGGENTFEDPQIALPIGISFFTFQALSYVIDVYRKDGFVQRNPINFALYIASFPQLIAGPIVRYRDVAEQLVNRVVTRPLFAEGVRRFLIGLGKKALIADTVALPADQIFALPTDELSAGAAWLGIVCYTLHIYFDFSGYSDMAIGLGRMFGFRFLENFNYPYISRSVTEFWRRWHISLSSWFRDYLYIPLGGNRRGPARTYFNLFTVFFLCGLWHGASWSFVVWGLYHGSLLVVERLGLGRLLARAPGPLALGFTLLAAMIGWVFFRAETLPHAIAYLGAMFVPAGDALHHAALFLDPAVLLALFCGALGSTPWLPALGRWRDECERSGNRRSLVVGLDLAGSAALLAVLVLAAMQLSAATYSPFIYFRF